MNLYVPICGVWPLSLHRTVGRMIPPLEEPPFGPPYPDPYPPPMMPFPNPFPKPGMLNLPPGPKNPPPSPWLLLFLLSLECMTWSGLDAGRVAKEGEAMKSSRENKMVIVGFIFVFFVFELKFQIFVWRSLVCSLCVKYDENGQVKNIYYRSWCILWFYTNKPGNWKKIYSK